MKDESQILEGNFLISVFNGWTYKDVAEFIKDPTSSELHNYHEDWNKLMPVVEKINKWHMETMCEKMDFYLLNQSICSSKKMVWDSCIEFITWYNSLTQDKKNVK